MSKEEAVILDLKISDKVRINSIGLGFVILATEDGLVKSKNTGTMIPKKARPSYYTNLHKAVSAGLHIAVEMEKPGSVEKYIELFKEFYDEVLSAADFVEDKYKIVNYSKC